MKLTLLLLPLFSFLNVNSPVYLHKHDPKFIQNTNINFENIDLSKLEVTFFQIGCFNRDQYRINFTKANNGYMIHVYYPPIQYSDITKSSPFKLIASKFIGNENLQEIKDILVTDHAIKSTMYNEIDISYNGVNYTFYDRTPNPLWQSFIHKMLSKKGYNTIDRYTYMVF